MTWPHLSAAQFRFLSFVSPTGCPIWECWLHAGVGAGPGWGGCLSLPASPEPLSCAGTRPWGVQSRRAPLALRLGLRVPGPRPTPSPAGAGARAQEGAEFLPRLQNPLANRYASCSFKTSLRPPPASSQCDRAVAKATALTPLSANFLANGAEPTRAAPRLCPSQPDAQLRPPRALSPQPPTPPAGHGPSCPG